MEAATPAEACRALALSLGRRRVLAADAEAQLDALEKGLAQHEFTATR